MFKLIINCPQCNKQYKNQTSYNNHLPLCKLLHEHNLNNTDNININDLFICIKDLALKCSKMEKKIEDLTRQNMVRTQKMDDTKWLTDNCVPSISYLNLIKNIKIKREHLEHLFNTDFVTTASLMILESLEKIPDNFKRPIQAFTHRKNTLYVYSNNKWSVLSKDNFNNLIKHIHVDLCKEFNLWSREVEHKLLNNDSFAIQFCLNTKKINGGALSPDETLKRCFNKIFNHISLKISNKIMYEFI